MLDIKNVFKALVSPHGSSTTKKNNKSLSRFDTLPDEIVLLILTELASDYQALYSMMKLSRRMSSLCFHVLSYHKFPYYTIEAVIDQEGHSRTFTQFDFGGVDVDTGSIYFLARAPVMRRYYTNKEAPTFRQIMLKNSNKTLPLNNKYTKNATEDQNPLEKLSIKDLSQKNETKDYPSAATANTFKVMIESQNQKIHKVKKNGLHNVQLSRSHHAQSRFMWRFGYEISNKVKKEYHFIPVHLDIHFSYLIKLIQ
ncbi:hypothetical protein BY458DRAFT_501744 [Sporodiniella umbellata]|nr:hypothetical protein BY458DRAFT_501744 [Sporodiniella umbellata]